MSQILTTPMSVVFNGRKRSEPSRATSRSSLTTEPAVAKAIGATAGAAYSYIPSAGVGVTVSRSGSVGVGDCDREPGRRLLTSDPVFAYAFLGVFLI